MQTSPQTQEFIPHEDALLSANKVELRHGGRTLVGPLTWEVLPGERWIVFGPNGAGKTSLMRLAAAEEFPSRGELQILGETLGKVDLRDLRAAIGLSSAALAHRIPGEEKVANLVISAGYAILGRWREEYDDFDEQRALDLLEQVGALHLYDRTWGTLSEGERKRVLVARALMVDPELLLLDEPAAGMDLGGREDLVAYLAELAADEDSPALVLVTHHLEEIPPGFTHALLLSDSEVVAQGPIGEVVTSQNISKAFGQDIEVSVVGDRYFARRAGGSLSRGSHRA
ncbi:MAG: ABC transporter ATP-binding protein [Corynebacterium sp.]|nr:ABC transporter ATP-binding protein [Corynebacterium sp.]